jgi:hypothetical protein
MAKPKLTTSGKIFFGTILLVLLFIAFLNLPKQNKFLPQQSSTTTTILATATSTPPTSTPATGRILIGFKDDFRRVAGIGTVTMLNLNIKQVYVRESNQTEWVPIFDGFKTFDIIALSNQTAIISDTFTLLKTYTQEKIVLGNGEIKVYNPTINIFNHTYSLSTESNETILSYSFTPAQGETVFLVFDLNVEKSIKHKLQGYFILPEFTPSSSLLPTVGSPENSIFIS